MIADIEFRWLKRKTGRQAFVPVNTMANSHRLAEEYEDVLQFRKQQIPSMTWTDWQDVPVVEE